MTACQENIQSVGLNVSVQRALGKHLLSSCPYEARGVLLGAAAAGGMRIGKDVPMRNVAPDPPHSFVPDPTEWIHVIYNQTSLAQLSHPHPCSVPLPSAAGRGWVTALLYALLK